MSDTCVGCRYNKDRGVVEIKSPATGYWKNSSEAKVTGTCQTFECVCPHPATCYDQERDVRRIYTSVEKPGVVKELLLENGCEHYTPTDEVLWEGNTIAGWLQYKIIKLGADEAIEEIAKKIQSLIVED